MNIFTFIPALVKVYGTVRQYNNNIPQFKKLREAGDIDAEKALIFSASGKWAEDTSAKLKVNYIIDGEENIPSEGPIMVYANHQGLADILAILYLFRNHFQMGFIAKDEWRKVKPLAQAIEYTKSVFLVRGGGREALQALSQSTELLQKGFSLCIFPEGTRSQKHEMAEFKPGSFKFAEKGGVPILPVTLDGSYKLFEENKSFKPNQTIKITVHPLVRFDKMDRHQKKEAASQIEETIRNGLEK